MKCLLLILILIFTLTTTARALACVENDISPIGSFLTGVSAWLHCKNNEQVAVVLGSSLGVSADSNPWYTIRNTPGLKQMTIRADSSVEFKDHFHLAGVNVSVVAPSITFWDGGILDVTPEVVPLTIHRAGATQGDGIWGNPGSIITVVAKDIRVEGNSLGPRLIANGGDGHPGTAGGKAGAGGAGGTVILRVVNLQNVPGMIASAGGGYPGLGAVGPGSESARGASGRIFWRPIQEKEFALY